MSTGFMLLLITLASFITYLVLLRQQGEMRQLQEDIAHIITILERLTDDGK